MKPSNPKKMGKQRPGPDPERLKVDGDWESAAALLVKAKKPASGWPGPKPRKSKKNSRSVRKLNSKGLTRSRRKTT